MSLCVSLNQALRKAFQEAADKEGFIIHLASPAFCTDNAVMIAFAALLRHKFEHEPPYRAVAEHSAVHVCPIQEFAAVEPYDIIISGLPLNNFPAELVRSIFETFFRLLAPGGTLSYFEYMYVRPLRKMVARPVEKKRLTELDQIANEYLMKYRIHRSWVFVNVPPAWVQHLRKEEQS